MASLRRGRGRDKGVWSESDPRHANRSRDTARTVVAAALPNHFAQPFCIAVKSPCRSASIASSHVASEEQVGDSLRGLDLLAHRREALEVGEKHGDFGELAARFEVEFVVRDPVCHLADLKRALATLSANTVLRY